MQWLLLTRVAPGTPCWHEAMVHICEAPCSDLLLLFSMVCAGAGLCAPVCCPVGHPAVPQEPHP